MDKTKKLLWLATLMTAQEDFVTEDIDRDELREGIEQFEITDEEIDQTIELYSGCDYDKINDYIRTEYFS